VIDADVLVDSADMDTTDLSQWLHETYYDDDKPPYFSENDLKAISKVLLILLRFRPSERPSADDIVLEALPGNHQWQSAGRQTRSGIWKWQSRAAEQSIANACNLTAQIGKAYLW
jgi:hypothetical protein